MDTSSRDDFIIAIRSAFLKKQNKQRFSLIFLIFLSLIFLILGRIDFKAINYVKISIKEIVYRSSFVVSVPENYLKNTYQAIKSHFVIYDDYLEIKSENDSLFDLYFSFIGSGSAKIIKNNSNYLKKAKKIYSRKNSTKNILRRIIYSFK